ncbi:MAG: sugar ABC transporter permease [Chloroflexota bacterium]|nr:MAG: sugar ABC transporter permease [Chloroflexota bacterium]
MEITTSRRLTFSLARGVQQLLSLPLMGALYLLDAVIGSIERLIGHKRMPYLFVLPNMAIFAIFILLPLLLNFFFAFTGGTSIIPENRPWVGLGNFERLFACQDITNVSTCREDVFFFAVRNTFLFVIVEVPSMVVLAMLIALALNRDIRLRGFFRSAFFFPVLLSPVVVALVWKWMLQTRGGLINTLLGFFGIAPIEFVLDGNWMMFWSIFVSVWAQVGFYALILLAGLQGIPPVLYEAAEIDGASELQRFWKVTLPMLRPTLLVVLVLSLIRGVQMFDHVYVLTGGGPGTATVLTVQYIYRTAFEPPNNWGMAAAVSLMLAAVLAMLTVIQLILNRRQTEAL